MLIELQNISFCYAGTDDKSLKNVSLSVDSGEFILLTGESGCGKTTLTRILNGLCPQFYNGEISGTYLLDGKMRLVWSLTRSAAKSEMSFKIQEVSFLLPMLRTRSYLQWRTGIIRMI